MSENKIRKFIRTIIIENEDNWWKSDSTVDTKDNKIPFNDEIKDELMKMFESSKSLNITDKEVRAEQLIQIHNKWIEIAKQNYDAKTIASKLYMYEVTMEKKRQSEQI